MTELRIAGGRVYDPANGQETANFIPFPIKSKPVAAR